MRDLTPEDYLDLIMHKTCWYTSIHPLAGRGAARIAGDGRPRGPMVRFGFHLGAAFQIQDDLLNLEGDEGEYGKEIDGDLFEGKRTLPLIHLAAEATGADRATVDRYLGLDRPERTAELVDEIRALLDAYGSIEFTRAYAQGIADTAVDAFEVGLRGRRTGPGRRVRPGARSPTCSAAAPDRQVDGTVMLSMSASMPATTRSTITCRTSRLVWA